MDLTHQRLLELVTYDAANGHFRRKSNGKQLKPNKDGYVYIRLDGKNYYGQRLAWFYVTGKWPSLEIDHKDLNRSNNAYSNLREASHSLNGRNCRARSHNRSGLKGVSFRPDRKKPFRAQISIDGRTRTIGIFASAEEAHAAYCQLSATLSGEFARAA